MRYLGGKARIRKELCAEIAKFRKPGQIVWEPFCGGLNSAVGHGGAVFCSDSSLALISLFQAVAAGWNPPRELSRAQWEIWRDLSKTDPRRGFARFGCTFGGMQSSGYATVVGRNIAAESRRALLRDVPKISWFACLDFLEVEPRPTDLLIYADPPYRGRTNYGFAFDHDLFEQRCRDWSQHTPVLVSEYAFPAGALLWEKTRSVANNGRPICNIERLYLVKP
jgi:DNA adenine methylase